MLSTILISLLILAVFVTASYRQGTNRRRRKDDCVGPVCRKRPPGI